MALMTQLQTVLDREGLFLKDKFEEWVKHSKTTHQPLDRVLLTSGYLTETQMLQVFGECLGLKVVDRLGEIKVPSVFADAREDRNCFSLAVYGFLRIEFNVGEAITFQYACM